MASPIWAIIGCVVVSLLQTSTRLQFCYTQTGNWLHFGVTMTALVRLMWCTVARNTIQAMIQVSRSDGVETFFKPECFRIFLH